MKRNIYLNPFKGRGSEISLASHFLKVTVFRIISLAPGCSLYCMSNKTGASVVLATQQQLCLYFFLVTIRRETNRVESWQPSRLSRWNQVRLSSGLMILPCFSINSLFQWDFYNNNNKRLTVCFHRGWFLYHPAGNCHSKKLQTSQHSGLLWQLHSVSFSVSFSRGQQKNSICSLTISSSKQSK